MANISGKGGNVTKQVSGVDTIITGIREWSITLNADQIDTTEFAVTAPTNHDYLIALKDWSATISGNHTSVVPQLTVGTEYNFEFVVVPTAGSEVSYYGTAAVQSTAPAGSVTGEATINYTLTGVSKLYILGANVVVDGGFTAASSAAWDVSDADVAYDTSNDQIDFSYVTNGEADLVPTSNDVITSAVVYYTQMKIENTVDNVSVTLKLGTAAGTARTADGTYTQFITANGTTFTVSGDVDSGDSVSLSEIVIRPVEN